MAKIDLLRSHRSQMFPDKSIRDIGQFRTHLLQCLNINRSLCRSLQETRETDFASITNSSRRHGQLDSPFNTSWWQRVPWCLASSQLAHANSTLVSGAVVQNTAIWKVRAGKSATAMYIWKVGSAGGSVLGACKHSGKKYVGRRRVLRLVGNRKRWASKR